MNKSKKRGIILGNIICISGIIFALVQVAATNKIVETAVIFLLFLIGIVIRIYSKKTGDLSENEHGEKQLEANEIKNEQILHVREKAELERKCENGKTIEMLINVDNYAEVKKCAPEDDRSQVSANVEKVLGSMAAESHGILKRLERDKFICLLKKEDFEIMKRDKFPVTEKIKSIFKGFPMIPTLSIGIGVEGEELTDIDKFAQEALDMALGRGGDQVVIKNEKKFEYFGGNSGDVERRSKVRARIYAGTLKELILKCDNVVIMGHQSPDADAIGAAVGICAFARKNSVRVNIVYGNEDKTVNDMKKILCAEDGYEDIFISPGEAQEYVNSKTLLCVVDTHKSSYVNVPELLDRTSNTAVIDHHRRSDGFIEKPTLLYHETYASSCCEMVAEMLQYMTEKPILSHAEATAVYCGIYLDTKGFSFKTGVRTFEAATYLRKMGVDPIEVKNLFRSDFNSFIKKSIIMQNAQVYGEGIVIARCEGENTPAFCAQIADELIGISDVDASFAITGCDNTAIISARSNGKINVQVIMEKLGGGGHMSAAGAQLKNTDIDSAVKMLKKAINEHINN